MYLIRSSGMAKETGPLRPDDEEEDSLVSGGGVPVPENEEAAKELLEKRMKEAEESLNAEHKAGAQHTDVSGDLFPPEKPPSK